MSETEGGQQETSKLKEKTMIIDRLRCQIQMDIEINVNRKATTKAIMKTLTEIDLMKEMKIITIPKVAT